MAAYFVPTEEATLTTVAGRALQGLGCGIACRSKQMGWYMRGVQSPALLGWYMPGVQSPSLLSGLGAGSGSGRFNRSVARGVYQLPFVESAPQGGYGLGQLSVDPTLLLLGIGTLAAAMFLLGGKTMPRFRRRRAARLRRRLRELEA